MTTMGRPEWGEVPETRRKDEAGLLARAIKP